LQHTDPIDISPVPTLNAQNLTRIFVLFQITDTMSSPSHDTEMEIELENIQFTNKRTTPNQQKDTPKKAKASSSTTQAQHEFWYGYQAMETLAYKASMPPITITTPTAELIKLGYVANEAEELRSARMSFPRVQQKLWPTTRPDNTVGQHFNITQLPFDVEIDPLTHLSLDYHILLHFEKPSTPLSQDQAMQKI
jgi:hypothetical protein